MAYQNVSPYYSRYKAPFYSEWGQNIVGWNTINANPHISSSSQSSSSMSKIRINSTSSGHSAQGQGETTFSSFEGPQLTEFGFAGNFSIRQSNRIISGETTSYTSGSPPSTFGSTNFISLTTTNSTSFNTTGSFSQSENNNFTFSVIYESIGNDHVFSRENDSVSTRNQTYFGETLSYSGSSVFKTTSSWTDAEIYLINSTAKFGKIPVMRTGVYTNGLSSKTIYEVPMFKIHPYKRVAALRPRSFNTYTEYSWNEDGRWFTDSNTVASSYRVILGEASIFPFIASGSPGTNTYETQLRSDFFPLTGTYHELTTRTLPNNAIETYTRTVSEEFAPSPFDSTAMQFGRKFCTAFTTRKSTCSVYDVLGTSRTNGENTFELKTVSSTYWISASYSSIRGLAVPAYSSFESEAGDSSGVSTSSQMYFNGGVTTVQPNVFISNQRCLGLIPESPNVYFSSLKSNLFAPFNTEYDKNLPLFSSSFYSIQSVENGSFEPYFPGFELFQGVKQFVDPLRGYYTFLVSTTTNGQIVTTTTIEPVSALATFLNVVPVTSTNSSESRNQRTVQSTSSYSIMTTYTKFNGTLSTIFEDTVLPIFKLNENSTQRKRFIFKRGNKVQTVVIDLQGPVRGNNLFELGIGGGLDNGSFAIGGINYPLSFFQRNYRTTIALRRGNWYLSRYENQNTAPLKIQARILPFEYKGLESVMFLENNNLIAGDNKNIYRTEILLDDQVDPYQFLVGLQFFYTRDLYFTVDNITNLLAPVVDFGAEDAGRNPRVFDTAQIYTNGFPQRRMNHSKNDEFYSTINIISSS